jgi:uncharacterized protein (TIGR02270 family)
VKTIRALVVQHAEEAAFLFVLRERMAAADSLALEAMVDVDSRIDAHLDGLRAAGADGRSACAAQLEALEPGELFAAAVLAFEAADEPQIATVLEAADQVAGAETALVRALEWIDPPRARAALEGLLRAKGVPVRAAALRFAASEGICDRQRLRAALRDDEPRLREAALVAAAGAGAAELCDSVGERLHDADPGVREEAAFAATLLGVGDCAKVLLALGRSESARRDAAFDLALRAFGQREAESLFADLARDPAQVRRAVRACAAWGDPSSLPWLVERMEDDALARRAGWALSVITGVDLVAEKLTRPAPDAPQSDSDALDEADDQLPWPDAARVAHWLKGRSADLRPGVRLLAGRAKATENLCAVLRDGRQSARNAAAIELALGKPDALLFDTRAPAFRQSERLASGPWR